LTETGDRTPQYYGVRDLMIKYGVPVPALTAKESKKIAYGSVKFTGAAKLFDNMEKLGTCVKSPFPLNMEKLDQAYGYIYYEAYLPAYLKDYYMQFDGLGDRVIVYIDDKKVGVVERGLEEQPIYFSTEDTPVKIGFLVENMGRTNFGPNLIDKKGLAGVRLRWEYVNRNLTGFDNVSLSMDNLETLAYSALSTKPCDEPTFYRGEFEVEEVADTFIKPSGFTKGFILINGVNIGSAGVIGPVRMDYAKIVAILDYIGKILTLLPGGGAQ
jgi:beta-galactosidase